jgi:hypothetical protein
MCVAEGVFKAILYRHVNPDGLSQKTPKRLNLHWDTNGAKGAGFGERLR